MKVSKFQNACHQAGLETETLGQKLSRLFKEHFQTAIAMAGVDNGQTRSARGL